MGLLGTLFVSVLIFTTCILILVILLLVAKSKLIIQGDVKLKINNDYSLTKIVPAGNTLLTSLNSQDILIPSACGGGGTCGMCKCMVTEGGGDILPTETNFISRAESKKNIRLACQVKVKNDLKLEIPSEIFNIRKYKCTVRSNQNVATFIKELVLDIDNKETLNFKAGGYIQIEIPPYDEIPYSRYDIQEQYHSDWNKLKMWNNVAKSDESVIRAYSMANHPAEGNKVILNVRIATPPPGSVHPPGIASSYLFSLIPGDKITISGPYGEFFIQETKREICFIAGGAGMAPMRSHIYNQFFTEKTKRKVSFWYGARSVQEMFYHKEFLDIEKSYDNFNYNVALSAQQPKDNWTGPTGFIHQALLNNYLLNHEDPTEIEYYLCGPPMMISAVSEMLYDLGVEKEMIMYDEF